MRRVDQYSINGPINTEMLTQVPGAEDVGRMVEDGSVLALLDKRTHVKVALRSRENRDD